MQELLSKSLEVSPLLSALIGAIIGGGFTFAGSFYQARQQAKQQRKVSLDKRMTTLIGLREEMVSLIALYQSRMGETISSFRCDTPFYNIFPLTQNYLTFYEANSSALAEVKSHTLTAIVSFYTSVRSLIDTYRANNEIIYKIDAARVACDVTNNAIHRKYLEKYLETGTDYGQKIVAIHKEVMQRYEYCLQALNNEIEQLKDLLALFR